MTGEYGEQGYTTVGREHYTTPGGHSALSTFALFLLGGAVGAAVALLLTPQSGKQTRQQIKEVSADVKEIVSSYYSQAHNKVSAVAVTGRELVKEGTPLFMAAIEAGKEAYEREREKVRKGQ